MTKQSLRQKGGAIWRPDVSGTRPRIEMKNCHRCGMGFDVEMNYCPRDGEPLVDSGEGFIGRVFDGQYQFATYNYGLAGQTLK